MGRGWSWLVIEGRFVMIFGWIWRVSELDLIESDDFVFVLV